MIPKIIHYCWFGKKSKPLKVQDCINSWEEHLHDYEIIEWNEENSIMNHPFIKQAYQAKKYAFVSDYVRLYVLYSSGGVYLDTDMFVTRKIDALLDNSIFFGFESRKCDYISAGIIGSIPKHKILKNLIEVYDRIGSGTVDFMSLRIPLLITHEYNKYIDKSDITIYPFDYFYPFPYEERKKRDQFLNYKTENTYAIHLWDKSWFTYKDYIKIKLQGLMRRFYKKQF